MKLVDSCKSCRTLHIWLPQLIKAVSRKQPVTIFTLPCGLLDNISRHLASLDEKKRKEKY